MYHIQNTAELLPTSFYHILIQLNSSRKKKNDAPQQL